MITYFPKVYPDELFYSWISRYIVHSGHLSQIEAMKHIYAKPRVKKEYWFIDVLNSDAFDIITRDKSFKDIIKEHTMYPYYSAFLSKEKREEALNGLLNFEGKYNNKFVLTPNRSNERYLKYCPLCVNEDRKKYGETYWHRCHQVTELNVCPIHGCYLHKNIIGKYKSSSMIPAESYAVDESIIYADDSLFAFARTVLELMEYQGDIGDVPIHNYLKRKLNGTEFISNTGRKVFIEKLFSELESLKEINIFQHSWQVSHLLAGKRANPYEILQFAFLLHLSVDDLMSRNMPKQSDYEKLVDKIEGMSKSGISLYEISKKTGIYATIIREIFNREKLDKPRECNVLSYEERNVEGEKQYWLDMIEKYPNMTYSAIRDTIQGGHRLTWLRIHEKEWTDQHMPCIARKSTKEEYNKEQDEIYYPQVKKIIKELLSDNINKPVRITDYQISQQLGFSNNRVRLYPKCHAEIVSHRETEEEYYIRCVLWALNQLLVSKKRRTFAQFKLIYNTKKEKLLSVRDKINVIDNIELINLYTEIIKQKPRD